MSRAYLQVVATPAFVPLALLSGGDAYLARAWLLELEEGLHIGYEVGCSCAGPDCESKGSGPCHLPHVHQPQGCEGCRKGWRRGCTVCRSVLALPSPAIPWHMRASVVCLLRSSPCLCLGTVLSQQSTWAFRVQIPRGHTGVFRTWAAKGLKEVLAKRAGCMHRGTGHVLCPPLGSCEASMHAIGL